MSEHRRRLSPQFRAEAVQVVIETGKPIAAGLIRLGADGRMAFLRGTSSGIRVAS